MAASSYSADRRFLFKIILLGDSGVGKTALTRKFKDNKFMPELPLTVSSEIVTYTFEADGCRVKARIWDTAGQERFRAVIRPLYRNTDAVLLMYDITRRETFESLPSWLKEIADHCPDDVKIFIVGGKADLQDQREVATDEAMRFTFENGLPFIETSAKEGVRVNETFEMVVRSLVKSAKTNPAEAWTPTDDSERVTLGSPAPAIPRRRCLCSGAGKASV